MEAKQKADELIEKYSKEVGKLSEGYASKYSEVAKQCALIACEEFISELYSDELCNPNSLSWETKLREWQSVKDHLINR